MNLRNNLDNSIQYFYNDVFRYSPEKVGVYFRPEAQLGSVLNANYYRMSGVSSCLRRVQAQDPPTPSLLLLRGEGSSFSLVCYCTVHSLFGAMSDLVKI